METLYRNLLRESAKLVDSNSVHFYQSRIKAGFRKECAEHLLPKRLKQARKLLRELQAANDGYLHALVRVLDHTYGRRGVVKQALLRPFTKPDSSPDTTHSFDRALSALVTSPIAHTSKHPSKAALLQPPTLPPRAFPDTDEARLLGPLSAERINKIRLRYRTEQTGKIKGPIAVILAQNNVKMTELELENLLREQGLVKVVIGSEILEKLEEKVRVPLGSQPRPPKRLQLKPPNIQHPNRASLSKKSTQKAVRIHPPSIKTTKWTAPVSITPRLLRRRYQNILQNSPIVVGLLQSKENISFSIKQSSWSNDGIAQSSELSEADQKWL